MNEDWNTYAKSWQPPSDWIQVLTFDAHTAGEPLRIYVDGFPVPEGETILERRQHAQQKLEKYRTGTMWEPRGHADMYGCLIVPPERPTSDFGVLFVHNEGYSSMCGHGIIAVAKVAVQTGWIKPEQGANTIPIQIDAPAGLIRATVHLDQGDVRHVSFLNVASFVAALDQSVMVEGLGEVQYDLGFGGAYYAYVDATSLSLDLVPERTSELIQAGRAIKRAVQEQVRQGEVELSHPEHDDLAFLYGTIFCGPATNPDHHSRHVCIFAEGEVDRSPTGTGVSGRAAILAARGQLPQSEVITIESILGTFFDVSWNESTQSGKFDAVVPKVTGSAYITGRNQFWFDPNDPLAEGFILR